MYTVKELEKYTVKQLKALADYDGIKYPKKVKKGQLIDLLVQLELPEDQQEHACSVRIQRIRDSRK